MKRNKRRIIGLLGALLAVVLVVGLAGCTKFTAGNPIKEAAPQGTPTEAVQKFINAMNNSKNADEAERNRAFDDYISVTDPNYFKDPTTGQALSAEQMNELRAAWTNTDKTSSDYWEAQFQDVTFEETQNDGTTAVVVMNGGLIQYSGKALWGTAEIKVDNFHDKPGRIDLIKIADKWYMTGGGEVNGSENWQTPPLSSP